ncbi:MAG TPA: histidine kinase [Mobilitalea sp.]|nr:histidine kinase [Mobilitalea sp.]
MKNINKRVFRKIFHSSSIFKQLVLFTAVISVAPIIFVSWLLFHRISDMVTDELVNSHYQLVAQYTSNLESKLYQYRDSLKQISNNTIILNTLMDKSDTKNPYVKGNDVSIEVNKSLNLDSKELRNCMIYSDIEASKIYGSRITMMDGASREIWYIHKKSLNKDYFIYSALDGKSKILSLIQNIIYIDLSNYTSKYVGFIKLDILMNRLFAPTTNADQQTYSYDILVLDKDNNIVYSSNHSYNDILSKVSYEQLQRNRINYFSDTMVVADAEHNYNLKLIFLFNNSQLSMRKAQIQKSVFPIFILVMVVIIITAFMFTRGFSRRVAKLVNKIKVAETGDLTITEALEGNDEIAVLDKQFNQMLVKLDNLIKKNYIQQLEKKESEFRNLQLQINPHFLYNTLETISSIAAVKQAFVICELCEKLGENFRYSLGKNYGEFVTVMQELQHTQNYVYIQKTRFGNKFEVFYNVDPEVENKLILRFILQPIVENAIVHGLSNIPGKGTLEISINKTEELLVIKIEDDGVGMPPEKVEEINQYINDSIGSDRKKQSIGIRNVNQRIKLACGSEYGITIVSSVNHGSCFTIELPLMQ